MPLRFTLVAALLVLAALGLLASGVAVTSSMERSLIDRTDTMLRDASRGWAKPREDRRLPPLAGEPGPDRPPTPFYVRSETPGGAIRFVINDGTAVPDLPADPGPDPITVGSVDDPGQHWRALTTTTLDGTVTLAVSLSDVDDTVEQLIILQLGIGAGVLAALGAAAYVVVRRSLRPLVEVEHTAAAIAAGDLHSRVPEYGGRTEVGRLSAALNGMLTQIQTAFAATEASEESARRSEQKMRRFVADASHELRTPLTTIRGFAELYRQGAMRDTELLMSRIEGEASRMGLLVEDLLMLARLDAQRPLARDTVDLLAVASDAVHDARAIAPDRAITLEVVDGPGRPEVLGDDARLRQVLTNLVSNALGHTPASASVTVRVGTVGRHALLEVADTGPGLDEQARERVFERFYRADTSRTRQSGGSGLGLSIVAALVAAHGGTVTVDSPEAGGAVFRVLLPRADQGADAPVRG
ncbi:sensor histidine kinase [Rhodococcus sp. NPDC058481]|uniref:sensor histidine kinase n=1 Tax=unclassified Rhodococcus (in: high G+C Gram-positive bacteria) TaxID=192944 RepID=UPI00364A972E